jgi:hypothetical protein
VIKTGNGFSRVKILEQLFARLVWGTVYQGSKLPVPISYNYATTEINHLHALTLNRIKSVDHENEGIAPGYGCRHLQTYREVIFKCFLEVPSTKNRIKHKKGKDYYKRRTLP